MHNQLHKKLIKKQLKQDLWGKDAYRGVTLSYTWLANQFGHFALGFIPAVLLHPFIDIFGGNDQSLILALLPALLVWVSWFVFEVVNFYKTVQKSRNENPEIKKVREEFFMPRKGHFRKDWMVDLAYFALGSVAGLFPFEIKLVPVFIGAFLLLLLAYEWKYWYLSKIFLQRAVLPFQYRLSQWDTALLPEQIQRIKQFSEASFSGTHFLVLGEDDHQKIRLCVGLASEYAYLLKKCRYLTAMKAFECFYRAEAEDSAGSHNYCWNWQEAELLVIDDVNPSHADLPEVITPPAFLKIIASRKEERNNNMLREKKVVWVLGNETAGGAVQREWEEMLVQIGIHRTNIITINLDSK